MSKDKWLDTRYRNLLEQIDIRQPRFILEFGTWKARTAYKMIMQAKKYRNDVFYFGIDLFEFLTVEQKQYEHSTKDYCTKKQAEEFLKKSKINHENFILLRGESKIVFPKIRERLLKEQFRTKYIDFIFIDGGHSLETILMDWISAESVMNDETVVIFDDYYDDVDDIGALAIVEFSIPHDQFIVEKLEPVDIYTLPDGREQRTRMVKVTRRLKPAIQNQGVDEQVYKHESI